VIASIRLCLNPYEEWGRFLEVACGPELRFVFSNTTEAGIVYVPEPRPTDACPASFPAKVAAALLARHEALGGDPSKGLVFLPCELIDRNGEKLRECALRHLEDWGANPAAQKWAREANIFANTLVDRIVPGYPREEAERVQGELGWRDELLDTGEYFHLWVIEAPAALREELPFHRAGLNVVWTEDLTPHRDRKVRVLNGAHSSCALAATLAGVETVGAMMTDPLLGAFARRLIFDEILPELRMGDADKRAYAEATLERFQNPFIRHELLSIALNSVSKWKVRVLPSLGDALRRGVRAPGLAFSLAALIRFYKIELENGEATGRRDDGRTYPVLDDAHALEFFAQAWKRHDESGDTPGLAREVLANTRLWDTDLNAQPGLANRVSAALGDILSLGTRGAIERLMKEPR
jgi:tagaturonate reductase